MRLIKIRRVHIASDSSNVLKRLISLSLSLPSSPSLLSRRNKYFLINTSRDGLRDVHKFPRGEDSISANGRARALSKQKLGKLILAAVQSVPYRGVF